MDIEIVPRQTENRISSSVTGDSDYDYEDVNNNNTNHHHSPSSSSASPPQSSSPTMRLAGEPQPTHLETPSTIWGGGCKMTSYVSNVLDLTSSTSSSTSFFAKTQHHNQKHELGTIWKPTIATTAEKSIMKKILNNNNGNDDESRFFFFHQQQASDDDEDIVGTNKILISPTGKISLLFSMTRDCFDILAVIQQSILENQKLEMTANNSNQEELASCSSSLSMFNFHSPYRKLMNTSFVCCLDHDVLHHQLLVESKSLTKLVKKDVQIDYPSIFCDDDKKEEKGHDDDQEDGRILVTIVKELNKPSWF